MLAALVAALRSLALICGGHRDVALENLALRQQLAVFKRAARRPQLHHRDRLFWILLAKAWRDWRTALIVVHPDTVVRWHRQWVRRQWARRSARTGPGRPSTDAAIRALVIKIAVANPLWGAPRIHGGVGQVGHSGVGANRLQARETAASPAVTDMANVPHESRPGVGLDGFRHRTDRHGSNPVRLPRPSPSPPADRSLQRHGASNGRLDRAASR